jgi:predicted P-loop ATPase
MENNMATPRTGNGRRSTGKRVSAEKYGQSDRDVQIVEHAPAANGHDMAPDWPDLAKKTDRPRKTYRNARAAMIALGMVCRFDMFHDRKLIDGERLSDDLCSMLRQRIIDRFDFDPGKDNVGDAAQQLCIESAFDPVLEYLDGLRWDGVPRVDTWLPEFLGAQDTALMRQIGMLTLVAAVRRVRKPGVKFDHVLVLEGPEGKMKSTAIVVLAGEENFSDQTILSVTDREQQELVAGVWLYEIAELAGMTKGEVEKIKAFVTRTHDRARGAYKRFRSEAPRRCIFIATTNETDYLKSQTGNRRFWPVRVGNIDIDRLRAERDQLWAETTFIERSGIPLMLPEDLWAAAVVEQNARVEVDPWDDLLNGIRGTLFRCDALTTASGQRFPPGDYEWLRSDDLMTSNLGIPRERINNGAYKRLRPVMVRLGWNEGRHYFGGDTQRRGYFRQIR